MNLKVQWMNRGDVVRDYALIFGFNSSQELFADPKKNLRVDWAETPFNGYELAYQNSLVITGFGEIDPPDDLDFILWEKGELEDGTRRYVYPLFNDPALPFRAGLTLHATKGTWSSLPHEFEREEILTPRPMPFYEKFAYVTQEPGGWGIQTRIGHLFTDYHPLELTEQRWVNDTVTIRDRDIIDIPLGSHSFTAGPGVLAGYFWVYWGDNLDSRQKFTKDKAL